VICPKCGEDNSDTFRFCGMCGTLLDPRAETRVEPTRVEARQSVDAPAPILPPNVATSALNSIPNQPRIMTAAENATSPISKSVPPISGPSMLGLDQLDTHGSSNQPGLKQAVREPTYEPAHPPTMDSLREKSFSGLDSFFEPERPKNGARRILLMMVLLAALGAAGWWTYTNYVGAAAPRKAETTPSSAADASSEAAAEPPTANPDAKSGTTAPDAGPPQTDASGASPSGAVPEGPSENAHTGSEDVPKGTAAEAQPEAEAKPVISKVTPEKHAPAEKIVAKRGVGMTASRTSRSAASKPTAAETVDTGDADFHKADAFLYGRGAAENCDQAVKYLKAASAKSNAKARSAFGTMYATGHCVPRDLPTSYLWFALALQVDPNNQILEKDLSAVWSEMTPPERQVATRMKQ
jgi:TPR repeat protein